MMLTAPMADRLSWLNKARRWPRLFALPPVSLCASLRLHDFLAISVADRHIWPALRQKTECDQCVEKCASTCLRNGSSPSLPCFPLKGRFCLPRFPLVLSGKGTAIRGEVMIEAPAQMDFAVCILHSIMLVTPRFLAASARHSWQKPYKQTCPASCRRWCSAMSCQALAFVGWDAVCTLWLVVSQDGMP